MDELKRPKIICRLRDSSKFIQFLFKFFIIINYLYNVTM